MVSEHLYHRGKKYWLYASYVDKKKAYDQAHKLKKRYNTPYLIFATDSIIGSYPVYHLYTSRVRRIWS